MTTVAWDGRTMAADRQLTLGGTALPLKKIFQCGNDFIGCCGSVQESMLFLSWYKDGRDPASKPKLDDGFSAMVIQAGECMRYENLLMPYLINMPFWASGSGADYALGAMAAGKSAQEAVEIAIRFDTSSGLGIDVLETGGLHA
jgi:ATP-dependent protease HslVU (ClpYQ) peptidase subunit